ncbi:MAG: hypothetical protein JW839_13395 [Candidatus Lokiarchaeota archaeon]|nr:hypothetical protein [Candidatus Lokiarchaeota archaeon]
MPKCKTCGSNITEKSKAEIQGAPGWKDECMACTKKKFEKYLSEYLLKLVLPEGLVALAKRYFGEAAVNVHEADPVAKIVPAITGLVYSRRGRQGIDAPATVGSAIASFVSFSDEALKENARPDTKTKKNLALVIAGAASIVVVSILVFIFA